MNTGCTDIPTDDAVVQPLPGEICEQYIRCGKIPCRCEQGQRHGPYFYRIWREGDHVHKVYVKRSELETVRQACEVYRNFQQILRDVRTQRATLSRSIQREWRQSQRLQREKRKAA